VYAEDSYVSFIISGWEGEEPLISRRRPPPEEPNEEDTGRTKNKREKKGEQTAGGTAPARRSGHLASSVLRSYLALQCCATDHAPC
jgi:hypothetical protein